MHTSFKIKQYIEILKNAQDAQMIGLNSGQDISPIPPRIFTEASKNKFYPTSPFRASDFQT